MRKTFWSASFAIPFLIIVIVFSSSGESNGLGRALTQAELTSVRGSVRCCDSEIFYQNCVGTGTGSCPNECYLGPKNGQSGCYSWNTNYSDASLELCDDDPSGSMECGEYTTRCYDVVQCGDIGQQTLNCHANNTCARPGYWTMFCYHCNLVWTTDPEMKDDEICGD